MQDTPPFGAPGGLGLLPDGGPLLPTLTEKQLDLLQFVYDYAIKNRDYPSGAEIATRFDISKQAVTSLVSTLVKKGYAFRDRQFITRNIRLTASAVEKLRVEGGETRDLFGQLP